MSSLLDSLKSLKEKLNEIEKADVTEVVLEELPFDNTELLKQRIVEFKKMQDSKLLVNVGGVMYTFSSQTLSNPKLPNIFSNSESPVFYDGSPELFKYIALIFRHFYGQDNTEAVKTIKIKINEDELILKEMIKQVFLNPDDLFTLVKIERESLPEPAANPNPIEVNPNNNAGGYNNNNARGYGY